MLRFVSLADVESDAIERLLDRAFGQDRHGRTAYAVRSNTQPIAALSFAALDGEVLVGTIQCWPVTFTRDDGGRAALTMVGPVAVDPQHQQTGIGRALMAQMLAAAQASGDDAAMMLIGDPDYYGRFYGFTADRTAAWLLPGPVERHRLLARGHAVPPGAGLLGPRIG